jgi:hypothetical protein
MRPSAKPRGVFQTRAQLSACLSIRLHAKDNKSPAQVTSRASACCCCHPAHCKVGSADNNIHYRPSHSMFTHDLKQPSVITRVQRRGRMWRGLREMESRCLQLVLRSKPHQHQQESSSKENTSCGGGCFFLFSFSLVPIRGHGNLPGTLKAQADN